MKKGLLRFVLFCNWLTIFFLLAGDLAPYLNPAKWWPVAIAGLLFPIFLLLTFLFFIFWLPVKASKAGYSLIAILLSLPVILVSTGRKLSSSFDPVKKRGDLRIMTWNTGLMNYTAADSNKAIAGNAVIFRKLKEADADVICLQEFFTAVIPGHHLNFIDSIDHSLHYPYHYFSYDWPKFDGKFYGGTIIFSRFPLADTQRIAYPEPFIGSILKAGLAVNGDTIDIVTSRLQSVHFQRNDYQYFSDLKTGAKEDLSGTRNIIRKLRRSYQQRVGQVSKLREIIKDCKHPVIFTGDLNDVPDSYTYYQVKNDLKDAWTKKGTGLGGTFVYISPTLRIDHIFYSKGLGARQIEKIRSEGSSDHHALLADFWIEKEH